MMTELERWAADVQTRAYHRGLRTGVREGLSHGLSRGFLLGTCLTLMTLALLRALEIW